MEPKSAAERFVDDYTLRMRGLVFTPEQALRMIREIMIHQRVPSKMEVA
jgi:hypothetical protein